MDLNRILRIIELPVLSMISIFGSPTQGTGINPPILSIFFRVIPARRKRPGRLPPVAPRTLLLYNHRSAEVRCQAGSVRPGKGAAMDVIKVSAESKTSAVAGAIAGVMREYKHAEVQAIGAGAVNQAVKACAIARTFLEGDGLNVVCIPSFVEVVIDGKERTALRLIVEPR